jgi:hypothetical protein
MTRNILLAGLLLLGFTACNKDVDELPALTETGANTFGAMVDGKIWVPQGFAGIPASNILNARYLGTTLFLKAQNFSSSPNETEFDITVVNLTATGTYLLNVSTAHPNYNNSYGYYVKRNLSPINEWITSVNHTGSVTITKFDTTNHIISGNFQFSAEEILNPASVITVSDGRFDVKY